jgi:transposase
LPLDGDERSGSGVVGYNVQVAVDTERHLIVAHEVTNVGNDTAHLANMASQAKQALQVQELEAVADRGYFKSDEILACEQAGVTVTLPKPMTSGAKAKGRFGKQDFVYSLEEDIYRCPAGERLTYRFTNVEEGKTMRRYWTTACSSCPLKPRASRGRCAAFPDGSTSTCLRPFSRGSMHIQRPCASGVRRSSIPSAP